MKGDLMASMKFLTESQIRQVEREIEAQRLAEEASALAARIARRGFVLEVTSIADEFGVATVRERDVHARARLQAVPAA